MSESLSTSRITSLVHSRYSVSEENSLGLLDIMSSHSQTIPPYGTGSQNIKDIGLIMVSMLYPSSNRELTSFVIDAYRIYSLYSHVADCVTLLDTVPSYPKNIDNLVIQGDVCSEAREFPSAYEIIRDVDHVIDSILISASNHRRLILYFSGHGTSQGFLFPNNKYMTWSMLQETLARLPKDSEVLLMLDCCCPNSLGLPFALSSESKRFQWIGGNFIQSKVILVTSANSNEKSVSISSGSFFTRFMCDSLPSLPSLPHLIREVNEKIRKRATGYDQTVSCWCSYPLSSVLWSWLIKLPIDIDDKMQCLVYHRYGNKQDE